MGGNSQKGSQIKQEISKATTLKYYDVTKEVTIQADTSQFGTAILQDGQPISYASRVMTPVERCYAQIEKECLSIYFTCNRFQHFIYGKTNIKVETDHQPLISNFGNYLL